MIWVNNLSELDGIEVQPGIFLIGQPTYHEESKKWRCLANVFGGLAVVELNISVSSQETTPTTAEMNATANRYSK